MRITRSQLCRLREQAEALLPPPPEPAKRLPPPWLIRWTQAISAEMYSQAGWSRDCARSGYEIDMWSLHETFNSAHYMFRRNLGCEPTPEEWHRWLEIDEEAAQRPDPGEAFKLLKGWCLYHAKKWSEARQVKPCAH